MNYKEIPILLAQQVAEEYDKDQVIIVTWDNAHQMSHITTYGRLREDSAKAAEGGNLVKAALGWPERLCHTTPSWWQEGVEEIGKLADTADNLMAATALPVSPQIHLEGLKSGMQELAIRLKQLYIHLAGKNPWQMGEDSDQPPEEGYHD